MHEGEKIQQDRKEKLERLRELGVEPYGSPFSDTIPIERVRSSYSEGSGDICGAAGRVVAIRAHGKSTFLDIRDGSGKMQAYLKSDDLGESAYKVMPLLDLGDILGLRGSLFKTRTGELTLAVRELRFLAKSLLPLPEKWHGLRDVEARFRHRYLDLISSEDTRERFLKRARAVSTLRKFLDDRGFLEVETPMMQPAAGGAAARPFVTHHNALKLDLFLRIAPELYLKKLLVGGLERVYEINRNFRNEGLSSRHNPEFTMLEVYEAYADYLKMMALCEEMIRAVFSAVDLPEVIRFGEREIRLTPPWKRRKFRDLLKEYAGVSASDWDAIVSKASSLGIEVKDRDRYVVADALFDHLVEDRLIDPTFVYDYPAELCPLARRKPDDPSTAERFELYVGGMEIANAYSELNDPILQKKNFEMQLKEAQHDWGALDEDFLLALEHGMPPAGGLGIGIDRLAMILTNSSSIREVILFRLLRAKEE